jgi:hypothetical protein
MKRMVEITRADVESGSTHELVDGLTRVLADPPFARSMQGGTIIMFDGYNDDPREIEEIPEVLAYLRRIHEELRFLLYFLDPAPMAGAILHFIAAFGGHVSKAPTPPGGINVEPTDESMVALFDHLIEAVTLAERMADTPAEIVQRLVAPFPALEEAITERLG